MTITRKINKKIYGSVYSTKSKKRAQAYKKHLHQYKGMSARVIPTKNGYTVFMHYTGGRRLQKKSGIKRIKPWR